MSAAPVADRRRPVERASIARLARVRAHRARRARLDDDDDFHRAAGARACVRRGTRRGRCTTSSSTRQSTASHIAFAARHVRQALSAASQPAGERYLPAGAAVVAVLIFASYVDGAGPRSDLRAAPSARGRSSTPTTPPSCFPSCCFDVLVEAGLAAAFIPIFVAAPRDRPGDRGGRSLRAHDPDAGRGDHVMGIAVLLVRLRGSRRPAHRPGLRGEQRELYVSLFPGHAGHAGPLRRLADARPGPPRRAALLLVRRWRRCSTTGGSSSARLRSAAARDLRAGHRRRPRRGHPPRQPIRRPAGSALPDRASAGSLRTRVGARVRAAHAAEDGEPAGRADHLPVLHERGLGPRGGKPDGLQLSPATSRACRSASSASRSRSPPSRRSPTAHADRRPARLPAPARSTNLVSITALTVAAAIAMVVIGELAIGSCWAAVRSARTTSRARRAVLRAFALSVPFESLSHLLSRAIYATRHTLLQALASIAGLAITVVADAGSCSAARPPGAAARLRDRPGGEGLRLPGPGISRFACAPGRR